MKSVTTLCITRLGLTRRAMMTQAVAVIVAFALFTPFSAFAAQSLLLSESGEIGGVRLGGALSNTCNYKWWYGCSPTVAGMMIGYYDRNGYKGAEYSNLVPGGAAEQNTFGPGPYLANNAIASTGHIADFYSGGYGASGDDVSPPTHAFNSLADYMGTSQDAYGNSNGATTFWYYTDGSAFYDYDAFNSGYWPSDGMYGIGEYVNYTGYDTTTLYSRLLPGVADDLWGLPSNTLGFTFEDFMAEIDAGRPVMVQIENHSMLGYGYYYDDFGVPYINVYDTWAPNGQNPGVLAWGGYYGSLLHYGVAVMELPAIPAPGAILLGSIGTILVGWLRRKTIL